MKKFQVTYLAAARADGKWIEFEREATIEADAFFVSHAGDVFFKNQRGEDVAFFNHSRIVFLKEITA